MQLKESFAFDKQSFKILGFTDLGKATPENQKEKLGNHAVVIMYQPFSGAWVQPIGRDLKKIFPRYECHILNLYANFHPYLFFHSLDRLIFKPRCSSR